MPGAIVDNVAAPEVRETDLDVPQQKIITEPDNFSLYFLLALLGFGGLFVIYRFTKLRPNIEWLSKYITDITDITTKNKTENLNESTKQFSNLNSVSSVKELHEFLKYYARYNLNLPQNSSLGVIFSTIKGNSSNIKEEHYRQLVRKLEGALYANQDCDIVEIRRECLNFLKLVKKDKKQKIKKNESKLPKLNPIHP